MAAGAAVPLAAAADIVLAAESARFTLAYTKVGLTPDGGSSLLAASIGLHRALYLALLNPVLTAAEAQAMGLVMEIHPDDALGEAVEGVVRRLARGSRTALAAAKHLLRGRRYRHPRRLCGERRWPCGPPPADPTGAKVWRRFWPSGHRPSPRWSRARPSPTRDRAVSCGRCGTGTTV